MLSSAVRPLSRERGRYSSRGAGVFEGVFVGEVERVVGEAGSSSLGTLDEVGRVVLLVSSRCMRRACLDDFPDKLVGHGDA